VITLQFVRGTDLGARLIRWFGGGPSYSHVDIVMPDGELLGARSDTVGDIPPGVRIRPAAYIQSEIFLRVSIPANADQERYFYAFLNEQIGKPYDKVSIFSFLTGRNWRDESAWFCSELAAAALEQAGLLKVPQLPVNKITPATLLVIVSSVYPQQRT
jgi:uncharacterized protein YycO